MKIQKKILNIKHFLEFSSTYFTQAVFNGCFFGIRSIFVLYAISHFSFSEKEAIGFFAVFMTLCYGTSLIGGYIADKGLGVKNTIIIGGIYSAVGLLCILFPSHDFLFLGLALSALGSGFIKPNVPTAVGLLFEDPKDPRKDSVYSILYIAANFGGLITPVICGIIGKTYGWNYGIIFVAIVLAGATCFVYRTMRFHPSYKENLIFSKITLLGSNIALIIFLYFLFKYQGYFHSLMGIITCGSFVCLGTIFFHCNSREKKDVLTIILYILLFTVFATLYEQAGTSIMLFFENFVDRKVMGNVIPSSILMSLDPLFVLIIGPLLILLTTKYLEKKEPISGLTKIGWGFLCISANFLILALSTFLNGFPIPLLWIVGAFFIQTIGELWIAPVSFSKISQYAPLRFKSLLMSFWSMAIAYGHYFAGFIAQFSLGNSPSLSLDRSFLSYQTFFIHLGMVPLCVGLSLLTFQAIKYNIKKEVF